MAMPSDKSVVCPVLIGRTASLASFERVFEQVGNGQGQTVLVSGEAGIGKSRLVAEEVLKSLLVTGDIFFTGSIWDRKPLAELHIPRSVSEAVQQRLSLLSDAARETLELAAVIGRHVDFSLVRALTRRSEAELIQCIETLIAAQLLVETSAEQCAFRHALTQQAVYQGLLAHKRKALHLTIAQVMEHLYAATLDACMADLAYHFYQAQAWTQALEYAQRVGEKALALYAPGAALEQFTHALEAASHLPESNLIPLYRARGQAYEYLGHFEAAQGDFVQVLETARATQNRQAEWQSLMVLGTLWTGRDYTRPRHIQAQAARAPRRYRRTGDHREPGRLNR